MPALITRMRELAGRAGRSVWTSPTLALMLLASAALSRVEPGYNHMVGAYALVGLVALNLNSWTGRATESDLALPVSFLAAAAWIWWYGNADVVPYLAIVFFACAAAACAIQLARRRPGTFREEGRVAENYLDTAARGVLALTATAMGLVWMPQPRYLAAPFTLLIAFRLATPLRRILYPLALATVGLEPTSGRARRVAATRGGYTPARAALLAASLVIAALLAPRLVFTRARVDLTIPKPYSLPRDLLQQRRAELEAYVARPAGSRDAAALTELGFVLHDLGLSDRSQLPRAEAALRRALSLDPGRAEAVAWYGSTLAAQALHEKRPVPRMRLVADGLAALDRAVAMSPEDPMVRLARASVCLGLPRFIGRLPTAHEDVDRLLELARTHPRETDAILPYVYPLAGDTYALLGRPEQARTYWRAALAELPERSPDYRRVAASLATLEPRRAAGPVPPHAGVAEARP
ncbi:MAG: hypothetical protein DMF78_24820 [Acidobacteria bacterium]|nr:MAG: hypothetical protein DMF78_24820 [Acidobacteriota bacterium]